MLVTFHFLLIQISDDGIVESCSTSKEKENVSVLFHSIIFIETRSIVREKEVIRISQGSLLAEVTC